MRSKRRVFFCAAAVAALVAVAAVMMVIGRGHTMYFDNKAIEYNGQSCGAFYQVDVFVKGKEVANLYEKDRGTAVWLGQNFHMDLRVVPEEDGEETFYSVNIKLPYGMDGIIINIPAVLELPKDAWITEFIPVPSKEEDEEEPQISGDDFGLGGEFDMEGF